MDGFPFSSWGFRYCVSLSLSRLMRFVFVYRVRFVFSYKKCVFTKTPFPTIHFTVVVILCTSRLAERTNERYLNSRGRVSFPYGWGICGKAPIQIFLWKYRCRVLCRFVYIIYMFFCIPYRFTNLLLLELDWDFTMQMHWKNFCISYLRRLRIQQRDESMTDEKDKWFP